VADGIGDVTVLGTSLANGQSPDGNFDIYFSHTMAAAVNVTVLDCGFSECTAGALAETTYATLAADGVTLSVENAGAIYGKRYRLVVTEALFSRASGGLGPAETYTVDFSVGCSKPGFLPSPDSAVWRFNVQTPLADIGSYLVCFRQSPAEEFMPIPSGDGATALTVVAIAADRAHPRGIFHNQKFSVLAGSGLPRHLKVLGTGLPYPADSRVLLNAHPSGVCGDRSKYTSVDLTYVSPDEVAPKAKYSEFYPEPSGTSVSVSTSQQILLAFSEAVVQAPCYDVNTSYISLVSIGNAPTQRVMCHNTVVMHNKVVASLTRSQVLAASQYYVRVETGGLTDASGNDLTILQTLDTYIIDTTADATPPAVIASFPCSGCEESLEFEHNSTKRNNTVMLYLSEDSFGVDGKLLRLFDCLGDMVCDADTDVEIATIDLGASWQVHFGYGVLYVYFGPLESARRYRLTLEANSLGEVGGGGLVGPEQMFELEFFKGVGGFDFRKHSIAPAAALSSNGLYTFPLQIPAATPVGTYTVCYCHDQDDTKLQDVGDADTRFLLFDDVQVAEAEVYIPTGVDVVELAAAEHQCATKCSEGCTGPYCFCDGYTLSATLKTLCLPPGLCRDVCDADPECNGISIHDELNQCHLFKGSVTNGTVTLETAEAWQTYEKQFGRSCTHYHDFQEVAGTIEVTKRVELEVEFVLPPGQEGSIEVVSAGLEGMLTYAHSDVPAHGEDNRLFTGSKLLSRDRITIVDGDGLCGVSSPSSLITLPGSSIEDWMDLFPFSWYREAAHEDNENPLPVDPVTGQTTATEEEIAAAEEKQLVYTPTTPEGHYASRDGYYCPGRNLDLDTVEAVFEGTVHSLRDHQCYTKCGPGSTCAGKNEDDCWCSGHYDGYDGPDSNALCADVRLCQYICDQLEGCGSIDMHKTRPRCFLNLVGCNSHEDALYTDANYAILFKRADPNDEQVGRGNQHDPDARRARSLLAAPEMGFSWDQMLRFKGLQFSSGGRFKLCFCDSEIHSSCNKAADYGVEVGEVHVSGVSCLVENPRLQRVACASQFHGGLRCYPRVESAPMPTEPHVGMTALPSPDAVTPLSLATVEGALGPDQTAVFMACQGLGPDEAEHDETCAAALAATYDRRVRV
jgi:hypothetical protein